MTNPREELLEHLPREFPWKILLDQILVEGPQSGNVHPLAALGIQIIWVEGINPPEHRAIMVTHEILVFPLLVKRVTGMIANHIKGFLREVIFDYMIEIFVVTTGHDYAAKATPLLKTPKSG